MEIYGWNQGILDQRDSLWEALELPEDFPVIVSLVGAGGKTHVMYRLADEMAARGLRVAATTSTHIYEPADYPVCLAETAEEARGMIQSGRVLVVGRRLQADGRKLSGLPETEIGRLSSFADVLLIEADGAKRLPLKAPAAHEPVILPETRVVIGCCGLDSIGQKLGECCFRPELAARVLAGAESPECAPAGSKSPVQTPGRIRASGSVSGKASGGEDSSGSSYTDSHIVTPDDVARLLTAENGIRKGTGGRPYRMVLNKADGAAERELAVQVITAVLANQQNTGFARSAACLLPVTAVTSFSDERADEAEQTARREAESEP